MKRILMMSVVLFGMGLCAADKQGRDLYEPIVLPPLEKLKVELAMDPVIRKALSSKPMSFSESALGQLGVLLTPPHDPIQEEEKRVALKELNDNYHQQKANLKALTDARKNTENAWLFKEKRLELLDEALKQRKKSLEEIENVRNLSMLLLEVPVEDPLLVQNFKNLEKNMELEDKKIALKAQIKDNEHAHYDPFGKHITLNPSSFLRIKGEDVPLDESAHFALAHEMGHAKYNAGSELVGGTVIGGMAGAKVFNTLAKRFAGGTPRSKLMRAGLGLTGAVSIGAGSVFGKSLAGKHAESVADIVGLEYALPIHNAKDNNEKFEKTLSIMRWLKGSSKENRSNHGYLSPEQIAYAAQRMYKPELHKPYETENNPGQFVAEHGGI